MTFLPFSRLGDATLRACVISLVLGVTASAQLTAPLGERRIVPNSGVPRWLGDVSACGGPLCTQTASAETSIPLMGSVQLVVGGAAARLFGPRETWAGERRLDVRYATNAFSAWAGAVRTDGLVSDTTSPLRTRFETGLRFATANAELAISVSAGRRPSYSTDLTAIPAYGVPTDTGARIRQDSVQNGDTSSPGAIASLTEIRGSWSVGRFLLSTIAGGGLGGRSSPTLWGTIEAATPLPRGPLAFLNAGFANTSGPIGFMGVPRQSISLGLRFSSATFGSRAAERRSKEALASPFVAQREAPGQYRLRVKIQGAHFVELASDCTGWKPVQLIRRDGNDWEVVLPVSAGSHLVNIRVDGGAWIAPPGLVAKSDDFAGAVGVFVVD